MKILLHTCCGPCTIVPLKHLRAEGGTVIAYFTNPNIHPYQEWRRRREALEQLAEHEDLKVLPHQPYDPTEWLRGVAHREGQRCRLCYYQRFKDVAARARRGRFDGFTTTLLYSRHQKHELIAEVAQTVADEMDIPFVYRDWRPGWDEGVRVSRELGLYRQPYCGCIYSEWERYVPRGSRSGVDAAEDPKR